MDSTTRLLVTLLARTDALFEPQRLSPQSLKLAAAISERRGLYRRAGLLLIGGGTDAARQAHSREMGSARDAGYIQTSGKARPTVRLTHAGDDFLRKLTGCYRVVESWWLLELVAELADAGRTNAGCVQETIVLGIGYDRVTSKQLGALELQTAPLLARGLLDSASDIEGRIGYAVTSAGRAALAAGKPAEPADLPEYSNDAGDFYDEALAAAQDDRDAWQPERPNHVAIPLGAGSWPAREAKQ